MRHLDEQVLRYEGIPRHKGSRSKRVEKEGILTAIVIGAIFAVAGFALVIQTLG